MTRFTRRRAIYGALALATIGIGLLEHRHAPALGRRLGDALGDALWAAMMVWWISMIAPTASRWSRCGVAYAICVVVEVSQAYHSPMLDTIRASRIGQLVLGSGFDPRDLLAYAIGIVAAALVDALLAIRRQSV